MDSCRAISDESELREVLRNMTRELGFNQYALLHHVDLVQPPAHAITLMGYEDGWMERIIANRYFQDDPILAASNRRLTGFGWREVPEIIRLSRRQRQILHEARAHGLRDGFTVPVQVAGEYRGTCSFANDRPIELTPDIIGNAQLVGMFCFEAARRIAKLGGASPSKMPELTQRQLDCLVHVGSGKTSWETSVILGVSEDTVDKHISSAMERYGVGKRTLLVVRALFDGQLSYRDMLRMH
jgi:DNA-binding CsgD family transcriptional regulator